MEEKDVVGDDTCFGLPGLEDSLLEGPLSDDEVAALLPFNLNVCSQLTGLSPDTGYRIDRRSHVGLHR